MVNVSDRNQHNGLDKETIVKKSKLGDIIIEKKDIGQDSDNVKMAMKINNKGKLKKL